MLMCRYEVEVGVDPQLKKKLGRPSSTSHVGLEKVHFHAVVYSYGMIVSMIIGR